MEVRGRLWMTRVGWIRKVGGSERRGGCARDESRGTKRRSRPMGRRRWSLTVRLRSSSWLTSKPDLRKQKRWRGSQEFFSGELITPDPPPQPERLREVRIQGNPEGEDEGDEDDESGWIPSVEVYCPTENGKEIDEEHKEDDQLRATLRAINEMVSAILSWD